MSKTFETEEEALAFHAAENARQMKEGAKPDDIVPYMAPNFGLPTKTMSDTTRLKIQLHIPGMEYFWHGIDLSKATTDPEEIWRTILTLKPWIEENCAMAKRQLQAQEGAPRVD
jgi:hypothetical protein